MNHLLFLQSLLFMNFGNNQFIDYQIGNCLAMKTDGNVGRCNRAYNTGRILSADIDAIKNFFNSTPFTWVIDQQDMLNRKLLEEYSLVFKGYFPAMFLDLNQAAFQKIDTGIIVKEVMLEDEFNVWASIALQCYYHLRNKEELIKALRFLKNRAQENIQFYVGYYKGKPVATSMLAYHGDHVSIHFVGTLEQFRRNGLGRSMISFPLSVAKDLGYHSAILMASPEGLSLAQQLGFKEYITYAIYGNY